MLYSGHFSFDETSPENQPRHGYFTCMVQAGTPELALQKFRTRIQDIIDEQQDPVFTGIHAVYVEDIVEIADMPKDAVVTRFQSSDGPFPKSRSCSLPTSDTQKIKAYQWVPQTSQGDGPADERLGLADSSGYKEAVPFMEFTGQ